MCIISKDESYMQGGCVRRDRAEGPPLLEEEEEEGESRKREKWKRSV